MARFSADGSSAELITENVSGLCCAEDGLSLNYQAIALDGAGNIYLTGTVTPGGFGGVTPGAFQQSCNDIDNFPDVSFVEKRALDFSRVYGTYLCPTDIEDFLPVTQPAGIAVDAAGHAFVVGSTNSKKFPIVKPIQDHQANTGNAFNAFVTEFSADGKSVLFSSYLGGSGAAALGDDEGNGIAVDGSGNVYVVGQTASTDFPRANPLQASNGGFDDAFVAKIGLGPACDPGALGFTASKFTVEENRAVATIGVARSGGTCGAASVRYDLAAGTARSGINYRRVRGVLDWAEGDGSVKTFTVPIIDDGRFSSTLLAQLQLGSVSGADLGAGVAELDIVNQDPRPTVGLKSGDRTVRGPASVNLVASLSAVSGIDTKIALSFSGNAVSGVDYRLSGTSILIPAGQPSGKLTIEIPAGAAAGGSKTLTATVRGASGASPTGVLVNTITIRAP